MSKQLAVSAAFSIFAMAALALLADANGATQLRAGVSIAPVRVEAPAAANATRRLVLPFFGG